MSYQKINNFTLPDGYDYEGPFIKQTIYRKFDYNNNYKARQSTNDAMSFMRLGWLASHIPVDEMKTMSLVDIGCGNGAFLNCVSNKFKMACGYDVSGESISYEELYSHQWDLVVLSDVLEHFEDITDLLKLKWRYAMISFPETPSVKSFDELSKWRHFKPNEHLYHLDKQGMKQWIVNMDPEISLVGAGHFEDLIRTRWNPEVPNITTMLFFRPNGH